MRKGRKIGGGIKDAEAVVGEKQVFANLTYDSGFKIVFTPFSFLMAFLTTLCGVIYTIIGLKILSGGKVAIYAMFLMSGGMLLPFLYGAIFGGEDITGWHIAGALTIVLAIAISNFDKVKPTGKQIAMSITVFVLNGLLGIFSKIHQTAESFEVVSTESFVAMGNLIKATLTAAILLAVTLLAKRKGIDPVPTDGTQLGDKTKYRKIIPYVLLFLVAAADCVSYFCQLEGSVDIPATVLFPLVSGGSIVMTAAVGILILKEKPSKNTVIGMIICVLGMCMFI